jgi:hypothetical protein
MASGLYVDMIDYEKLRIKHSRDAKQLRKARALIRDIERSLSGIDLLQDT